MLCAFILTWKCASGHSAASNFSTCQLPRVVRDRQFFHIFIGTRASRHSGVQFFISYLARWLRTRRFSEPTFRPSQPTNHCKSIPFHDLPIISRTCISFLPTLSFSLLLFSSSLLSFHLSILSEVWLLNFLWQCMIESYLICVAVN